MKRILIIDDDEFILLGLARALSEWQTSEVVTARHGKQAVDILDREQFDIVITDLKMPVMNGYELADYISKNYPLMPLYVMTGDYLPDVKSRFRTGIVSRFVSKPFSFRQLASEVLSLPDPQVQKKTA